MSKKADNYLLKKTQVGKVKDGFHNLPAEGHIYGKAPQKDKHDARDVISNWAQYEPSSVKEPGRDYLAMNKQGVKSGCKNSKEITNFRKDHEIKQKVKQGQKYYGVNIPVQNFTYGISNRPSTPIKNVICNSYAAEQQQLKQEREAVLKMIKTDNKKVPKVQSPKKLVNEKVDRKKLVEQNNFKLSKFKNVESKIKPMITQQKNKA